MVMIGVSGSSPIFSLISGIEPVRIVPLFKVNTLIDQSSPLLQEECIRAAMEHTGITRDGCIGVLVAVHNVLTGQNMSIAKEETDLPDNVIDFVAYKEAKKNRKNYFA